MPKIVQSKAIYRHYHLPRCSPHSLEESDESDSTTRYYPNVLQTYDFRAQSVLREYDEDQQILWLAEAHLREKGRYVLQRPELNRLGYRGKTIYDTPRLDAAALEQRKRNVARRRLLHLAASATTSQSVTTGRRRSLIDETLIQAHSGKELLAVPQNLPPSTLSLNLKGCEVSSRDDAESSSSSPRSSPPSLIWSDGMESDLTRSDTPYSCVLGDKHTNQVSQTAYVKPLNFDMFIRDLCAEPSYFPGRERNPLDATKGLSVETLKEYSTCIQTWGREDADAMFEEFINTDYCEEVDV